MRVTESVNTTITAEQKRHSLDRDVKVVFQDVLGTVGVDGFRSVAAASQSENGSATQPLDEQAGEVWHDWYALQQTGRYRDILGESKQRSEQLGNDFGSLVMRAVNEGGYADPKGFLRELSPEQLDVVRQIHSLADSIAVQSLSDEGALNLLIPPVAQVDLNRDGLTQSGAGFGIRFPDSNTPAEVAQAWDDATAHLSWGEKSRYELQMKLPVLLANLHTNPDGTFSYQVEPGDPRFVNPMAMDGYSYSVAIQDQIDYLDAFRSQIAPDRYSRDRAFWTGFGSRLSASG